jgi:ABC-type nitrate/sulfonate/bicarbonate transport system permease component
MSSVSDPAPATRVRAARNGLDGTLPALTLGAIILILWLVASGTDLVSSRVLPAPIEFIEAAGKTLRSSTLWSATAATLTSWLVSLVFAVAAAAVLGVLIGALPLLYRALVGVIEFFRPIPSVAILPLALLLSGPTTTTKVLLTTYTAFWPMLIQTIYGVRGTDPVLKDVAASLSLTALQTGRRIILPSALPSMAVGFRIGASVSLILCVTLEIIVGMSGLGREIFVAQTSGATARMYTFIAVTGLLGWGLNTLFRRAERAALHWHAAHRPGSG